MGGWEDISESSNAPHTFNYNFFFRADIYKMYDGVSGWLWNIFLVFNSTRSPDANLLSQQMVYLPLCSLRMEVIWLAPFLP